MKLHFFKFEDRTPNFGDDLNAWLWPKLLPGLEERCPDVTLIGFGTLLNNSLAERVPRQEIKLVFGAGVGYGAGLPELDESYRMYCIRGLKSAEALGMDPDVAVTDAAMLVNQVYRPKQLGGGGVAFMPHVDSAVSGRRAWQSVCSALGIRYIDPTSPVEEVLADIARSDLLLAEAMHGAIVADAFRRPWVPLATSIVLPFKWLDWCSSLQLEYRPMKLTPVWDGPPVGLLSKEQAKRAIRSALAGQCLWRAKARRRASLSDQTVFDRVMGRLQQRLAVLQRDLEAGRFESAFRPGSFKQKASL